MAEEKETIPELVIRAAHGDQYAVKSLYGHFAKDMFNISIRMTGSKEDAEDIVQESFVKAFNNIGQLKNANAFGGWLRQIVINNSLQLSKKKYRFESLDETEDHEYAEDDSYEWMTHNKFTVIHQAITKLPDGCRQIFLLYILEDFTHKQIGTMLNVSESTSKSQYLRAKKLLKIQLEGLNG